MAARRCPKRRQKGPENVPGALKNVLGASQERPWNVPSASWEHSEIRPSALGEPRSVSEMIWDRFGTQKGVPEVDFRGCRGCILAFSGDVSILRASISACNQARASRQFANVLSLRGASVLRRLFVRSPFQGSSLELSKTPRWMLLLYDLLCCDPKSASSMYSIYEYIFAKHGNYNEDLGSSM